MTSTARPQEFHAGLIFTDETDVVIETLLAPLRTAFDTFGEAARAEPDTSFDRIELMGRSYGIEVQIFDAPDADPDALRMLPETTHGDSAIDQAIAAPTLWVHVSVRMLNEATALERGTAQAMLAEIVHHYVELTGAPLVQWLDRETVLRADRFLAAFKPIRYRKAEVQALADIQTAETDIRPRRIRPLSTELATRRRAAAASPFAVANADTLDQRYGEIQSAAAKAANAWIGYEDAPAPAPKAGDGMADLRALAEVFRSEPTVFDKSDEQAMPIEARLATWTVNASVAIFSPPVGAALLVYNLLKGENFRVSVHTLALVGASMALGVHQAMAQGLSALAF